MIFFSIFTFLITGCTQKYVDYNSIHKLSYVSAPHFDSPPVAPVLPKGRNDQLGHCFNQILFFSNADKERNSYLPEMIQVLCPGSEWLMESRITTTWWTTLVFTRACAEVETICPALK